MTLVVNLYGGPGTGKSTTASLVFGNLKVKGVNTEYVHEYAKDLTWENRTKALGFQPYVIGKQLYKVYKLFGQVDVVVTDSPVLLGVIYADRDLPESFKEFLVDMHNSWNTLDIFLERQDTVHRYKSSGRSQTLHEAVGIDNAIKRMLDANSIPFYTLSIAKGAETADRVVEIIQNHLEK